MKALTADALLPFAIAAILGFLVLGLKGERSEPLRVRGPSSVVASDEGKPAKKLPELRVQLDQLPPS